jgi:ribonuclease R
MQQAYYFPENFGHFGLALQSYAHFTSPIRRYADLIVHRALISAHGWGDDGMTPELAERLGDVGKHISDTERRSMAAERDTNDRYLAAYLSDRVGATFQGRISGVARFGAFVKLIETGAEGVLPIRHLGREYFHFDADAHTLIGSQTGLTIAIGARVVVKLQQAVAATGGLQFDLIEIEGTPAPRPRSRKGGGYGRKTPTGGRKAGAHKKRAIKLRKKTARRRQT